MSEKRFKLDFDNHSQGAIMDRQDKYGQYCRLYDFGEVGRQQIVDLLNSLNDENEQLRQIATRTEEEKEEYADLYNECRKENEQLRQEVAHWKHQAEKLEKFAEWSDGV